MKTLKREIQNRDHCISVVQPDLGKLFSNNFLLPGKVYGSDLPVTIVKVGTIHIDCNLTGTFYKDVPSHAKYESAIRYKPRFSIDESPKNTIYLPISKKRDINNARLKILDQNFELVNFREQEIIISLELKKLT